jgi:hypothetical protein
MVVPVNLLSHLVVNVIHTMRYHSPDIFLYFCYVWHTYSPSPYYLAVRVRAILMAAEGIGNDTIGQRPGLPCGNLFRLAFLKRQYNVNYPGSNGPDRTDRLQQLSPVSIDSG